MISFVIGLSLGYWVRNIKLAFVIAIIYGVLVGIIVGQVDHRDGAGFGVPVFVLFGLLIVIIVRSWCEHKPIKRFKQIAPKIVNDPINNIWVLVAFVHRKLAVIWALQNRGLSAIGLLPLFQRRSWLYVIVFLLLGLIFPTLALIYAVVGFSYITERDEYGNRQ